MGQSSFSGENYSHKTDKPGNANAIAVKIRSLQATTFVEVNETTDGECPVR